MAHPRDRVPPGTGETKGRRESSLDENGIHGNMQVGADTVAMHFLFVLFCTELLFPTLLM